MIVLIDTNVILDYALKREPFAQAAFECFERLILDKSKVWLTASTITDIYYVAKRALKDDGAAKKIIAKLLNALQIAGVDKTDCLNALDIDSNDYEDALVSICAKKVKAEYIITRNIKDFQNSFVPSITPGDFLDKFYLQ
jgi:predicted nucleic acid-binding protein